MQYFKVSNIGMTERAFYWCAKVLRRKPKRPNGHGEGSLDMETDQSIRDLGVSPTIPGGICGSLPPLLILWRIKCTES